MLKSVKQNRISIIIYIETVDESYIPAPAVRKVGNVGNVFTQKCNKSCKAFFSTIMKQNPKCTSFENNNYIEYGQNSLQKINISFEIGLIANGGRKETG